MPTLDRDELVFCFPDVNERAVLRAHFRGKYPAGEVVRLAAAPAGGFVPVVRGQLTLYLKPQYPFAILLSFGGVNALTGETSGDRPARPQNYFVSPPQGGIDGYFADGRVNSFLVRSEALEDRTPLEIKVCPMKAEAYAWLAHKRRLIPGPPSWGCHFVLPCGGERECEPIYEDVCCFGDWDWRRGETATVWLHR